MQITSIKQTEYFGARIDQALLNEFKRIKKTIPASNRSDVLFSMRSFERLFQDGEIITEHNNQSGIFLIPLKGKKPIPLTVKSELKDLQYSDIVEISNKLYTFINYQKKDYIFFN